MTIKQKLEMSVNYGGNLYVSYHHDGRMMMVDYSLVGGLPNTVIKATNRNTKYIQRALDGMVAKGWIKNTVKEQVAKGWPIVHFFKNTKKS